MELAGEMVVHCIKINLVIYVHGRAKKTNNFRRNISLDFLDKCYYVEFVSADHFYNRMHQN